MAFVPNEAVMRTSELTQTIEVTSDEKKARAILIEAAAHAVSHICTWDDYETFKQRLVPLDLLPEQYALCCGGLAKLMGV